MPKLAKDAQIIARVTVEGSTRDHANKELRDLIGGIENAIRQAMEDPLKYRRTLSYDIYVSGDPQLGYGSKAHKKGVIGG